MPRLVKKKGSVFPTRSLGLFGCENCRDQHLKCDRVTPVCGRCQNTGRQCRRAGLRVRETKAKFAKTQKWVKTPRRLVFLYETNFERSPSPEDYLEVGSPGSLETVTGNPGRRDSVPSPAYSPITTEPSPRVPTKLFIPKSQHATYGPFTPEQPHDSHSKDPSYRGDCAPAIQGAQGRKRLSPSDRFLCPPPPEKPEVTSLEQPEFAPLEKPEFPLRESENDERIIARLLRHFIKNLAIWLDLCDPNLSFQRIVPQRASGCPILLWAICALSSRHLAHVDETFSKETCDRYGEECARLLKELDDQIWEQNSVDEDIFAATVIFRVFVELKTNDWGGSLRDYCLTNLKVLRLKEQLNPGSLGAAAFWVSLRQEIYNAVANRIEVGMLQQANMPSLVDRSLEPADDFTWANRAVVHCADVINSCNSKVRRTTIEEWDELMKWNHRWSSEAAPSFRPFYRGAERGEEGKRVPFPEIWYSQSCHVIGTQHHLLATLFLKRHEPKRPFEAQAQKEFELEQQERVRQICGIGLGNSWTPPSMFTACMAIHAFGNLFRDRKDQDAMMQLLRRTEKEYGRPTWIVQREMVRELGWACSPEDRVKLENKEWIRSY